MGISYTTGEDFTSGGTFLDQEGWFHFCVTDASDRPTKNDGSLINNAMFQASCTVAAGSAPGSVDKLFDFVFFHPKNDGSKGALMDQKKIDRALIAMNVISETDRGKPIEFEVSDFVGQQFIAKLTKNEKNGRLQLHYADIFHVDDPSVKDQEKNGQMLTLIKPEHRLVGDRPSDSGGVSKGGGGSAAPPQQPPQSAPPSSPAAVDLNTVEI